MKLTIAHEGQFLQVGDHVYHAHETDDRIGKRYLGPFEQVTFLARVAEADRVPDGWMRADGSGVAFRALSAYYGPWQYLRHRREVVRAVQEAAVGGQAFILRAPGRLHRCSGERCTLAAHRSVSKCQATPGWRLHRAA